MSYCDDDTSAVILGRGPGFAVPEDAFSSGIESSPNWEAWHENVARCWCQSCQFRKISILPAPLRLSKAIDWFGFHLIVDVTSGSIRRRKIMAGQQCSNSSDQTRLLGFCEAAVEVTCTGQLQRVMGLYLVSVGRLIIGFAISTCTLMNRTSACTTTTAPALVTARPAPTLERLISPEKTHHCPAIAVLVAFLARRKVANRVDVCGSGARGGFNSNTNRWTWPTRKL
jgi:hypothetical protein